MKWPDDQRMFRRLLMKTWLRIILILVVLGPVLAPAETPALFLQAVDTVVEPDAEIVDEGYRVLEEYIALVRSDRECDELLLLALWLLDHDPSQHASSLLYEWRERDRQQLGRAMRRLSRERREQIEESLSNYQRMLEHGNG
jgi:hypothetical protein